MLTGWPLFTDCPSKRNGNGRPVGNRTALSGSIHGPKRKVFLLRHWLILKEMLMPPRPWAVTPKAPRLKVFWIWPGMSGNGWEIIEIRIKVSAPCAAAPGTFNPTLCFAPRATTSSRTSGPTSMVFALLRFPPPVIPLDYLIIRPSGYLILRRRALGGKNEGRGKRDEGRGGRNPGNPGSDSTPTPAPFIFNGPIPPVSLSLAWETRLLPQ